MKRLSSEYVKVKAVHGLLLTLVKPPSELFHRPGYLHRLEGRLLYWLASQMPPNGRAVEVGSFKGKSSSFLAAGLRSGARLSCVDTWLNSSMPYDEPNDSLPQFLENTKKYRDRIDICRGKSADMAARWQRHIDLLFIDGDHSYEGCKTDLISWFPWVRQGGWIAFHDSGVDGVARVISEFFPSNVRYSELRAWSIFAARKRDSHSGTAVPSGK
jgi:predicted O-methyltransferase YrrM